MRRNNYMLFLEKLYKKAEGVAKNNLISLKNSFCTEKCMN